MTLPAYAISTDDDLEKAARDATSYDSTANELPGDKSSGQMRGIIEDAKRDMHIRTGSDKWYSDMAYGQALKAHTCILAKAAVENITLVEYDIGDEHVRLENADPEDSQQIQQWASQVATSLKQSDIDFGNEQNHGLRNTAVHVG